MSKNDPNIREAEQQYEQIVTAISEYSVACIQLDNSRQEKLENLLALIAREAATSAQARVTGMAAKGYVQHWKSCKRFEGGCNCGLNDYLAALGDVVGGGEDGK